MSTDIIYAAEKCPCGHRSCHSGNLRPVTFGQGVMRMEDAEDLARKLNAYAKLVDFVQRVSVFGAYEEDEGSDGAAYLRQDAKALLAEVGGRAA